jgi:hypothetical protein
MYLERHILFSHAIEFKTGRGGLLGGFPFHLDAQVVPSGLPVQATILSMWRRATPLVLLFPRWAKQQQRPTCREARTRSVGGEETRTMTLKRL